MTIKEIAQLSGVSISTVSKIMNHKDEHISPETRDKVLSIAKEYNYSPYAFARNTSISKSFLLGVLLRSEPNHGKLLDGILSAAEEAGYHVIVCIRNRQRRIKPTGPQKIPANGDRKSTRLNSSHNRESRMPSSA